MDDDAVMPKQVDRWAQNTEQILGRPVTTTQLDIRTWRISVVTHRVTASVDFVRRLNNWKQTNPLLVIDGETQPGTLSRRELKALLDEHDSVAGIHLHEITEPIDPNETPAYLQRVYYRYLTKFGEELVSIGRNDDGRLIVAVDPRPGAHLRVSVPAGARARSRTTSDAVQFVVDGVDRTQEFQAGSTQLRQFMLAQPDTPNPHGPASGPSAQARNNSVETRRSSVIRV
ncbi:hypothetical protein [Saccharopolyspora shandongensis]|uniref:hypothetical protein n=1 Tax=Saccharopolyspora shandongensis TaxID=418495 RepID=UPI0033FA426E